ncbi:MAG: peptidase U32 family protein [Elusimicrobiales bacterium]
MKILSCVTDPLEIPYIIKAGADEIYFGVSWLRNYIDTASFRNFEQLKKAIEICNKLNVNFHLAVNSFTTPYTESDIKNLKKTIKAGVRSVIVSDIGFGRYIKEEFPDISIHISSVVYVMNTACAEFIRKVLGKKFKRLILPNQLSAFEGKPIIEWCKKNEIKTEIFFFRYFGCPYLNGYCYLHGDRYLKMDISRDGSMCRFGHGGFEAKVIALGKENKKLLHRINDRLNHGNIPRILNASSFFDYFVNGVDFAKYGSRTDPTAVKIKNVSSIRKTIRNIEMLLSLYKTDEAKERFIAQYQRYEKRT